MEELIGPNFQVVLSIKEGKSFDEFLLPTKIVATLNNYALETDVTQAGSKNPQFATDLVWESNKSALRKMRSAHTPLKVECFCIKNEGVTEKIGYILLSVRSAQIIPKNKNLQPKVSWHKLLGVKNEVKVNKPELLVALTMEDRETKPESVPTQLSTVKDDNAAVNTDATTPSLLHNEHLIQLGPLNTCHDLFLLNVTATFAEYLDDLLSDNCKDDVNYNFTLWYKIFENDVQLKPFKKEFNSTWSLNEKIVIRIRSSLEVLKNYLEKKPYLLVYLKYNNSSVIIGQSEVDLRSLVPTANFEEFLESTDTVRSTDNASKLLDQRCFLNKLINDVPSKIVNVKPYLDLQLKLQYIGAKSDFAVQNNDISMQPSNYILHSSPDLPAECLKSSGHNNSTDIVLHRNANNAGGDFQKCGSGNCIMECTNNYKQINKHTVSCEVLQTQPRNITNSQSADIILQSYDNQDYSKSIEAYHCYCLNIVVVAIVLLSPELTIKNIEFRFHHPKAEVMSTMYPKMSITAGNKMKLQDIACKLHFISAAHDIKHLLQSFPPKISIYDAGGDNKVCISQVMIDAKYLFEQAKLECQLEVPLYNVNHDDIGNLEIALCLEDNGPYYKNKETLSGENLGPPILDDNLAYKIVDELETWKERHKEIFKTELRRKEERHLNLLSEEWQKHRANLESKLACSVEQCKILANSLNNATEDLRTRRLKSLEKETRLIKANEDLQWRYETNVKELKGLLSTVQEDLSNKITVLEEKKTTLEAQNEQLNHENNRLYALVKKQSDELEAYQKASLTQDQTATLLQELKALEEKLANAQKSKSFFKEQWGKAVREIHRIKMEHQQSVEVQIKSSKEELNNLDFENILCADSTALTNDQLLLEQIQKEIDVIRPKSLLLQKEKDNQIFAPSNVQSTFCHGKTNSTSNRSDEHEERLRMLIGERDALLKTRSYTIDDEVIVKLNTEIRSLLLS